MASKLIVNEIEHTFGSGTAVTMAKATIADATLTSATLTSATLTSATINGGTIASAVTGTLGSGVTGGAGLDGMVKTDRTSLFVIQGSFSEYTIQKSMYSFNGFMLISAMPYASSTPSGGAKVYQISDSDFYPLTRTAFPTISYQGDYAFYMEFETDGGVYVEIPGNVSHSDYHICINGSYRFD